MLEKKEAPTRRKGPPSSLENEAEQNAKLRDQYGGKSSKERRE